MAHGGASRADVICFATQGSGHGEEARIKALLDQTGAECLPFDRARKIRSAWRLLSTFFCRRPDLVVMEGTGVAGGIPVIIARVFAGVPYVVSKTPLGERGGNERGQKGRS